ncbi:MAG: hypothetical protein WDN45_00690 [Caulobacteraceae bacterium]
MKRIAFALLFAAAATPALCQTAGPSPGQIVAQQQANLNQFQAQLQANQLQQLQRQNTLALQQPDPGVQTQALVRQQQLQQQIDQNMALRQQMLRPDASATDINSRLQQYNAQIQQLQARRSPALIRPGRHGGTDCVSADWRMDISSKQRGAPRCSTPWRSFSWSCGSSASSPSTSAAA